MTEGKVYVVLLNWNGWRDTIDCLESLFASRFSRLRVVVCDNASRDGSLERVAAWAQGQLAAERPDHPRLTRLFRTVPEPVPSSDSTEPARRAGTAKQRLHWY